MNADGTSQVNLTSENPGSDANAAWSLDGRAIVLDSSYETAFCSDRSGHFAIYTLDADDGDNVTKLTPDSLEACPTTGRPTDRRSSSPTTSAAPARGSDIWVMDADGDNRRQLTRTPSENNSFRPGFSPNGKKIVFTREPIIDLEPFTTLPADIYGVTTGEQAIHSFDVATGGAAVELAPQADSRRTGVALGGTTVAWVDRTSVTSGEIVAYDSAAGTSHQLTLDAVVDRRPAVSPDGGVIVWEKCLNATDLCDIYKAVKSGSSWAVGQVTNTPYHHELNADTNGSVIVYEADRSASPTAFDTHIHWTPVAGGPESQLELSDIQVEPAVSGDLLTFENAASADGTTDLYAYDLSTNALYRLTDTAGLSERLNDVSVSAGGQVRVVWSVFETDENVYGLSFQLPAGPAYDFTGFFQPVDNPPTVNVVSAGQGVPVKFSLGGDGGLGVLAAGYPKSEQTPCDSSADVDGIESTAAAGSQGLSYDPASDT